MKQTALFICFLLAVFQGKSQSIQVIGGTKTPITYTTNIASSGLNAVFVLYGLDNAKLTYTSANPSPVIKWFKYTTNVNDSVLVKSEATATSELTGLANNTGYILVDGGQVQRVWVIDYKMYEVSALAVSSVNNNPCEELHLSVSAPLYELGYNEAFFPSARKKIDLQIPLKYKTMEYSDASKSYISKDVELAISTVRADVLVSTAPLMNTVFTLGDDVFSKQWNLNKSISTDEFTAVAVQGKGDPTHTVRDAENELDKGQDKLEGSAPVDITFKGYANEPTATYFKWEFSTDDKFSQIFASFTDKEIQYSFTDAKKYYVRFIVSNKNNICVDSSQVYTIDVYLSDLKVPRAFSPNGDGKNDVFMVEYKSILKFSGWIFNRWGNTLFTWSDPSKGWDGKIGGKYVNPGVYFYVIEAEGADGRKFKLKGDINVFR